MSIEVNGVTLPDIPADVLAIYPYATISSVVQGDTKMYFAVVATTAFGRFAAGVIPGDDPAYSCDMFISSGIGREAVIVADGEEWNFQEYEARTPIATFEGSYDLETMTQEWSLIWSNHNIVDITSINTETSERIVGDIYFSSSTGTNIEEAELPLVPDELTAKYPFYGILKWIEPTQTTYHLIGAPTPGAYVSPDVLGLSYGGLFCESDAGYIAYRYVVGESTDWELNENPDTGNGWAYIGESNSTTNSIVAANEHIYYAETYDAETQTITYSAEIYFLRNIFEEVKPDRVSIGISLMDKLANEVQRLTGTTDQTNAETMRTLLKAAESGGTREEDDSEIEMDTDRASIDYELFNDIVAEVQRLSGVTEQMNAVTAYRRLTGVAADLPIILYGIELPPFPDEDYPYVFIYVQEYPEYDEYVFQLQFSKEKYYYYYRNSNDGYMYCPSDIDAGGAHYQLYKSELEAGETWYSTGTSSASNMVYYSTKYSNTGIKWSNYNIRKDDPDTGTIVVERV